MIALAEDYLMFELASGETVAFAPAHIQIELKGENAVLFDSEFVRHAANAIFHYFKHELGRQTVTVAEFAGALEKILSGFASRASTLAGQPRGGAVVEFDLRRLVGKEEGDAELLFFVKLREELRRQLSRCPRLVRFSGLRGCVKHLTGARRWSDRCRKLEEEIVVYLRQCLSIEPKENEISMVVE